MKVAYTGHETLTFTDYVDLGTGSTLVAGPGGVYDIAPASGRTVTEVPFPWFVAVQEQEQETPAAAKAEEEPEGSG